MHGRHITRTYVKPSIEDYEYLYDLHDGNIDCACTKISIPYRSFVTLFNVAAFHEICSTDAVDNSLTVGKILEAGEIFTNKIDFQTWSDAFIDGIKKICQLAQESVLHDIQTFLSSTMLAYNIIPRIEFNSKINITLNQMKLTTVQAFARTLDLLRSTIQGNALIGLFTSSWKFVKINNTEGDNSMFLTVPTNQNTTCSCITTKSCSQPAQVFNYDGALRYTCQGIVMGCSLLESILQSSFSCFYSMKCVKEIRTAFSLFWPEDLETWANETNTTITLNAQLTRFSIDDTFETLAYNMFIESWITNVSYELFFNSCQPEKCAYMYHRRFDILQLLTIFLSLFSGVSLALRFLLIHTVILIESMKTDVRVLPTE
ncbi:unnamed protein product [Adineta ricciae]|uniref:Uncharacterized protein n=1 Tax=Adineta ricciae TaxID=249248 RepID=A0A815BPU2_ADIRI|nr:unnamed protein product [Adineta ricciae]